MHDSLMIERGPLVTDKHFLSETLMKKFKVLKFPPHFVTKFLNFPEDYYLKLTRVSYR